MYLIYPPLATELESTTGCHNGTGGGSCCSSSNQCFAGEGDCDDNVDCKGNLKCGEDNCNPALGFGSEFDCCYDPEKSMCDNWSLFAQKRKSYVIKCKNI